MYEMAIQLEKDIIIEGTTYLFTEIYGKDYAYFITDNDIKTVYCRSSDDCYLWNSEMSIWGRIDKSLQIEQITVIKNQIGEIKVETQSHYDKTKLTLYGRGFTAALKGSLTTKIIDDLDRTCYPNYYKLSQLTSFGLPTLSNNEVIESSQIKVNIQGSKFASTTKLKSVDHSAILPYFSLM